MKGYVATFLGFVVGGSLGLATGVAVGFAVIDDDGGGLEVLSEVFVVGFALSWVGIVAGTLAALRIAGVGRARETAGWIAILAPLVGGGGTWAAVSMTDADDLGSGFLPYLIFVAAVIACVYGARRLAVDSAPPAAEPGPRDGLERN